MEPHPLAFFTDSIDVHVPPPAAATHLRHLGATTTVLKYAPRRLRPDSGNEAIANAQADARYWRERAFKAETQLRALETRLRQLAAKAAR
jgi:hypothetical protein